MDIEELIKKLIDIDNNYADSEEVCHRFMDEEILDSINDERVNELFYRHDKWYT